MRGYRWFAIALFAIGSALAAGCQSAGAPRTVVSPAPSISSRVDGDTTVVDGSQQLAPPRNLTWVDRHPLFSKPRDYWDTSGDNKVVKAAAATFVGVPAGLYGEVKQIIVGAPQEPRY
jgi:hypothetical protein